jgi:hypothetical protein
MLRPTMYGALFLFDREYAPIIALVRYHVRPARRTYSGLCLAP